jgi:hypothetical protein
VTAVVAAIFRRYAWDVDDLAEKIKSAEVLRLGYTIKTLDRGTYRSWQIEFYIPDKRQSDCTVGEEEDEATNG